jgi:hypothetical protein
MFHDGAARRRVVARWNMTATLLGSTAFLLAASSVGKAATIPLPRPRPEILRGEQFPTPKTDLAPSPCQQALTGLAVFEPLPPITGPGECAATDVVKVDAVLLPDKRRVAFSPSVTLRCPTADAVARWIGDDVAPTIAELGTSLRSVETLESFDCRPRDGIPGEKISEHGRANALDVRSFKLANGRSIALNDNAAVAEPLREKLRDSACARFSTVLGNGADAYHNSHVHLDLMERRNHYKICQWDVLDHNETGTLVAGKTAAAAPILAEAGGKNDVPPPRRRMAVDTKVVAGPWRDARRIPSAGDAEEQPVTMGPWTIAASRKGDKIENCAMTRSASQLGITFLRSEDGMLLVLDSKKWKLERGKAYAVRLVAGSRSVEAKALADLKAVRIALVDQALNKRLLTASALEVRAEGETLRVPLDESTAAFGRLDACFDKNRQASVDTNPFVAPNRKP